MEQVENVAKELNRLYQEDNGGEYIGAMRLQHLLYLVQRESFIRSNEPLLAESFEGWKYGPVIPAVYEAYVHGTLFEGSAADMSEEVRDMIRFVYERYKKLSPWKLSLVTHGAFSWKHAREGLTQDQNGSRPLELIDIRIDATREALRRRIDSAYALRTGKTIS